jgi:hypothetical protein
MRLCRCQLEYYGTNILGMDYVNALHRSAKLRMCRGFGGRRNGAMSLMLAIALLAWNGPK